MTAADHTPSPATDDPSVFIGSGALLAALHDTYVEHIGMVEPDGPDRPYMWCACGWRSDDLDGNGTVSDNPGLSYAVHLSNAQHAAAVKALQPIVRRVTPSPATDGLREAVEALVGAPNPRAAVAGSPYSTGRWDAFAEVRAVLAAHPAPPSETATEGSWLRDEYARAKARNAQIPPHAGMVVTSPDFGVPTERTHPAPPVSSDESVRRYLDRVESVTTNENVLSVIREIRDELAVSVEETQP